MIQKVLEVIKKEALVEAGELIVAGVSGGADSICLLSVLFELKEVLGIRLAAVHVHHGIRGEEADRDAAFVKAFCQEKQIPLRIYYRDVPKLARERGMSEEEAGRQVRYECFGDALEMWKGCKAAVAHNQNDNAETVLFNLFRGSGLKGLSGMGIKGSLPGKKEGTLIRPLLFVTRREIEEYLESGHIEFCQDSTNMSETYSRNRIRRQILPQAELLNEQAIAHIVQAAGMIGEIDKWLDDFASQWLKDHCRIETNVVCFPCDLLESLGNVQAGCVMRKAIEHLSGELKDITKHHTDSIMGLINKQPGRHISLPGGLAAERKYGEIQLAAGNCKKTAEGESSGGILQLYPLEEEKQTEFFGYTFAYRWFKWDGHEKIPENRYTKWFDYDKIKDNLCLRGRRPGDYFQAFRDGRRQSVKAYMINEKIPSGERAGIPLLADGSHVLWIIGGRISEAYKVTEDTRQILAVTVLENNKNRLKF